MTSGPFSAESHNRWVDDLLDGIEFEPLRGMIMRLKEPADIEVHTGRCLSDVTADDMDVCMYILLDKDRQEPTTFQSTVIDMALAGF